MWCGRWRASGFAWCVRSQVVGIATRRGAWDETAARPAHARPTKCHRQRQLRHRLSGVLPFFSCFLTSSVFGSLCAVT